MANKVLHVITTIERGGAENQLLVLIREQIEAGWQVEVMPLKGSLDLTKEIEMIKAQNVTLSKKLSKICKQKPKPKGC